MILRYLPNDITLKHIDRYPKSDVFKRVVHVIRHAHILTELFRKTDNWQQIYKQANSTFYSPNKVFLKIKC